jgi:hypothetical protein
MDIKMRNDYIDRGDYVEVICNRGVVYLDKDCIHLIPDRTITVSKNMQYAFFKLNNKAIKLHRWLLSVTDPKIQVDHEDNNPLNNRIYNMRLCNNQLNCRNRRNRKNSSIKYKGVHLTKQNNYMARIQIDKATRLCLGRFNTAEEASEAYNKACTKYHKEYARLNE